jgi:hypothetical protein
MRHDEVVVRPSRMLIAVAFAVVAIVAPGAYVAAANGIGGAFGHWFSGRIDRVIEDGTTTTTTTTAVPVAP